MNVCDECGQARCVCGKRRAPEAPRRAATPAEQLAIVFNRWDGAWPVQLPYDHHGAALRWIDLQEPRKRTERISYVAVVSGDGKQREVDSYVERIKATLQAFLLGDNALRDLVVEAVKEKIYWRGESMDMFVRVYGETLQMRKVGVAEYRKTTITAAKKLAARLTPKRAPERVTGYNDEAQHDG